MLQSIPLNNPAIREVAREILILTLCHCFTLPNSIAIASDLKNPEAPVSITFRESNEQVSYLLKDDPQSEIDMNENLLVIIDILNEIRVIAEDNPIFIASTIYQACGLLLVDKDEITFCSPRNTMTLEKNTDEDLSYNIKIKNKDGEYKYKIGNKPQYEVSFTLLFGAVSKVLSLADIRDIVIGLVLDETHNY